MQIRIPWQVVRVVAVLEQAGEAAYLVGGCVRDCLLDRQPHDWDVTTAALPQRMIKLFEAQGLPTVTTGAKHGTVTVIVDHMPVECTTFRVDGSYTDARHPDGVRFTPSLAEDLARRDFTVNAMALRLPPAVLTRQAEDGFVPLLANEQSDVVDLMGGRDDLARGIIRCVGEATTRFAEDALRMLRAVRFCVKLGFALDAKTEQALLTCADGLAKVSAERITAELTQLLSDGRSCAAALAVMARAGLWRHIDGQERNGAATEADFAAIDRLPPRATLRLAWLWRDRTDDEAASLCRYLRLSRLQEREIRAYLALSRADYPETDGALRRLMSTFGTLTEDGLRLCEQIAGSPALQARWADAVERSAAVRVRGDCLSVSELALCAKDIQTKVGLGGRALGACQAYLLSHVLEHPKDNTEEQLLALAQAFRGGE